MNLTINGQEYHDLDTGLTVLALLDFLNLPRTKIAVECNREIVSKSAYDTHILGDQDRLEIIHFIGGG